MATKTTKNNRALTYPCIVEIKKAMGLKRKEEVIRAIDRVTGEDLSKTIVYPTLRNAFYAGVDLVKESIDSKWVRIEKTDAEARQIIEETGLCTGIAAAAAPAPVTKPAKVHKPAKAATPALGAPTKSKKATKPAKAIATTPAAVAKASKAHKAAIADFEPSEADIQEIQHMLDMGLEDIDSITDGFDSI
jgi:Xaa-Pro aminopeptidase